MRLIKQCFLYFREGKSDKVYEIDLCDVGDDKYVVNFRYGRKGANLKEGSKTPVPVSLAEAEKIFNAVQDEKLSKGYTTSEDGISSIPRPAAFKLDIQLPISTDWMAMPHSRNKSVLLRLHNTVQASGPMPRTNWKLSRVIWKAGEYKITEAVPYIVKLFNTGDPLHQYTCTWALARCCNEASANVLEAIYNDHHSPLISKIAGAGLLHVLTGLKKDQHALHYLNALPEAIKAVIEANQPAELNTLLQERIAQQQPQYNWLEQLYLLSIDRKWLRPFVKQLLIQVPLKPNYFKHIRAVFKLAELLDDFEITGLLAGRFEREEAMFVHHVPASDKESEIFVATIDDDVNPHKELQKKNSRLAYSQKTRWYLHKRIRRRLNLLGNTSNTDYVKLATSILIAYNKKLDFKEAFATSTYQWNGRSYVTKETRFPQNAQAIFMHQILSGDHPELELAGGKIWRMRSQTERRSSPKAASGKGNGDGILKKIMNLFGKKKASSSYTQQAPAEEPTPAPNENGTPFLHLWNKLPQSYVQLLMEAQLDEIHEFAVGGLTTHPSYNEIREKLDKQACIKLLLSPFPIPADFGFTLVSQKYNIQQPDADLVMAMLNSINDKARNKGKQWTETYKNDYFQQSDFVTDLLFARYAEIQSWAKELIRNHSFADDLKNAVIGKSIAHVMGITEMNAENEPVLNAASDTLFELFGTELKEVSINVIADLLQHPAPVVLLLGLRLLKTKKQQLQPGSLNKNLLFGLVHHSYAPVREEGISLLNDLSDEALLSYQDEIIACCLSIYQNVRQGMPPLVDRMAKKEKAFGVKAAETLMPYLLRKEPSEGLHTDVSRLLCNELSDHLQNADKETALRLLYGNYAAAQNVGVVILEKYTDPSQLTIPQVIALGNHENSNVRAWTWKFYTEQTARVKYEKEAAIKLLESKWEDTRQFAVQYFREHFAEGDWSPEALITLADSVKPDIEAFGRELITRFFDSAQGVQYLLKLSQHPSEKMQLFATNYLERFAAGDVAKIQSLEFYFRSVLTRVNKSRIAKNRIYHFLLTEGRKSEEAAKVVSEILSDVSAIAAIGDKAKCIEVLLQLKSLYAVQTPLQVKEIETRN